MGCDIHLYNEKKVAGKWVTMDEWERDSGGYLDVPWEKRFTRRNYELFGFLAQVRETCEFGFQPRGLPVSMCEELTELAQRDVNHTPSYLYLHELRHSLELIKGKQLRISGMMERRQLEKLKASLASATPDYNLLFPYCADTNDPAQTDFEVEVPAYFYFGKGLEEILSRFPADADGSAHRIVFWFDN